MEVQRPFASPDSVGVSPSTAALPMEDLDAYYTGFQPEEERLTPQRLKDIMEELGIDTTDLDLVADTEGAREPTGDDWDLSQYLQGDQGAVDEDFEEEDEEENEEDDFGVEDEELGEGDGEDFDDEDEELQNIEPLDADELGLDDLNEAGQGDLSDIATGGLATVGLATGGLAAMEALNDDDMDEFEEEYGEAAGAAVGEEEDYGEADMEDYGAAYGEADVEAASVAVQPMGDWRKRGALDKAGTWGSRFYMSEFIQQHCAFFTDMRRRGSGNVRAVDIQTSRDPGLVLAVVREYLMAMDDDLASNARSVINVVDSREDVFAGKPSSGKGKYDTFRLLFFFKPQIEAAMAGLGIESSDDLAALWRDQLDQELPGAYLEVLYGVIYMVELARQMKQSRQRNSPGDRQLASREAARIITTDIPYLCGAQ